MGDVSTHLYIIRHAEAEGNVFRRAHGQYNGHVTANGVKQLERLSERFKSIPLDAVYSSDLYRTHRTALAVSEPKGLPVVTDPRLREMLLGPWEDRTWGDAAHRNPEAFDAFMHHLAAFRLEGAETLVEMGSRMEEAVREIVARHAGGTVAVVSHGMAIRSLLGRLLRVADEDIERIRHVDNASVTLLKFAPDCTVTEEYIGDASHLGDLSTLSKQSWYLTGEVRRDIGLWFRPAELPRDAEELVRRQKEAWVRVYGSDRGFEPEKCLRVTEDMASDDPRCVQFVMDIDKTMGLLLLSLRKSTTEAGHIALITLDEEYCGKGLGLQVLGEAVSFFRGRKRSALRLNVWQGNQYAQKFYAENGFMKIREDQGLFGPQDILERSILPDRKI